MTPNTDDDDQSESTPNTIHLPAIKEIPRGDLFTFKLYYSIVSISVIYQRLIYLINHPKHHKSKYDHSFRSAIQFQQSTSSATLQGDNPLPCFSSATITPSIPPSPPPVTSAPPDQMKRLITNANCYKLWFKNIGMDWFGIDRWRRKSKWHEINLFLITKSFDKYI